MGELSFENFFVFVYVERMTTSLAGRSVPSSDRDRVASGDRTAAHPEETTALAS